MENKANENAQWDKMSEDDLDNVAGGEGIVNTVYKKTQNQPVVTDAVYRKSTNVISGGKAGKPTGTGNGGKPGVGKITYV